MTRIISIINRKGGVAKTTTAFNLAVALCREGKKVLLIDSDPQASLTLSMGFSDSESYTLTNVYADLFSDEYDPYSAKKFLKHSEGVFLLPSDNMLSGQGNFLSANPLKIPAFKKFTDVLNGDVKILDGDSEIGVKFDFVLIDCSPNLDGLSLSALRASTDVIIPTQPAFLSAHGISDLLDSIEMVRQMGNTNLNIMGVLLTMIDRSSYARDTGTQISNICTAKNIHLFKAEIPRSVKVPECTDMGRSIFSHNPSGKVAKEYELLAKEVIVL